MILRCASFNEASKFFAMLEHVPDELFQPVDVYIYSGPLYRIVRTIDGEQTTAPLVVPLPHIHIPSTP